MKECCHTDRHGQHGREEAWHKDPLFLISLVGIVFVIAGLFVSFLAPFTAAFLEYLGLIWWAILLGLFIGGVIDYLIPQSYISKILAQKEKKTILSAVGLGFLMSVCSHGILAISMQLYKKGASVPAVVAFLLASPWANLTMSIMLFGFFGLKAVFIIVFALVIAVVTGLIFQFLDRLELIESNPAYEPNVGFSITEDVKRRFQKAWKKGFDIVKVLRGIGKGAWSLTNMVLWWVLIGMMFAAAANAYVPVAFFEQYMGATIAGMLVTLVVATLIEVCSEGSSPLAFEIFRQTGALGNSFIFLLAGVSTDYTEIGLIWKNIGKKAALWLPAVTVPQVLVVAWLFNVFL